jgi:LysM repeat protein
MAVVTAMLTNKAYGSVTRGGKRRVKPTILAVLHQTAGLSSAMAERNHANRPKSMGPSATAYIDKDGTVVRAVNPDLYCAWCQGDVNHPNPALHVLAAAIASGKNVNEWVYESLEVVGRGTQPYSTAQFEAVAQLVAAASRATGIPVTRETVLAHRDINSVSRASDPWPGTTYSAHLKRVIDRANAILHPVVPAKVFHTVTSGDTLGGIAAKAKLTLAKLLAFPENAKYRANPSMIHVGDKVRVK